MPQLINKSLLNFCLIDPYRAHAFKQAVLLGNIGSLIGSVKQVVIRLLENILQTG